MPGKKQFIEALPKCDFIRLSLGEHNVRVVCRLLVITGCGYVEKLGQERYCGVKKPLSVLARLGSARSML